MKRLTLLAFVLSLVSVLAGLALVLAFIAHFLVPSARKHPVFRTECTVKAIDVKTVSVPCDSGMASDAYSSRDIVTSQRTNRSAGTQNGSLDLCSDACVMVSVSYKDKPYVWSAEKSAANTAKDGVLLAPPSGTSLPGGAEAFMHKCFCLGCVSLNVNQNGSHHSRSEPPITPLTSVTFAGTTVTLRDRVECLLHPGVDLGTEGVADLAPDVQDSGQLVHIIFWPTLVFILGFVGLVFTSVAMAKDGWGLGTKRQGDKSDV